MGNKKKIDTIKLELSAVDAWATLHGLALANDAMERHKELFPNSDTKENAIRSWVAARLIRLMEEKWIKNYEQDPPAKPRKRRSSGTRGWTLRKG